MSLGFGRRQRLFWLRSLYWNSIGIELEAINLFIHFWQILRTIWRLSSQSLLICYVVCNYGNHSSLSLVVNIETNVFGNGMSSNEGLYITWQELSISPRSPMSFRCPYVPWVRCVWCGPQCLGFKSTFRCLGWLHDSNDSSFIIEW